MQLRGATASHVGNVRETNQDRAHFAGFVAAVADGMGGHQGGEMAASIAIEEFLEVIDPIGPGGLVELVEGANRAVFERAADPDLRGMGTTLVALTLRPAEEKVGVVNVGDSRAYLLRGREFNQVTLDHSLVEDLVRQNRLTPEEALIHPNRNILTRALGIASEVEVDRFLIPTNIGDRFLLCSDGLFNEVTEEEITQILLECEQPNEAADTLITAALTGPGRDNVTVAVIDVVSDGAGGNVSSTPPPTLRMPVVDAVSSDGSGEPPPDVTLDLEQPSGGGADEPPARADSDPAWAVTSVGVSVDVVEPDLFEADLELAYSDAVDTIEVPLSPPPRRRGRLRRILFGLSFVALLTIGAYYASDWYVKQTWFIGVVDDEKLVVYNGRPSGFPWVIDAVEETGVMADGTLDELTGEDRVTVLEQKLYGSIREVEEFITSLDFDSVVSEEQTGAVSLGEIESGIESESNAESDSSADSEADTPSTTAGS